MNGEWLKLGTDGVVPIHWTTIAKGADDTGELEGWASVYNVVDNQDDIVVPGAFAKAIQDWRGNKGKVIALTSAHDNSPAGVIGSVSKAQETAYGLKLGFKYSTAPDAQAVRLKAKEGHVNGLSVFGPILRHSFESRDGRDLRVIQEAGLWAVGLTPMPANELALVTAAKDPDGADRERERRDGGMSEVWVCDMKSALAITVPVARKAAVDLLVKSQYGTIAAATVETDTADEETDATSETYVDASTYALSLIGESAPGESPPSGAPSPPGSPADHLLATLSVAKTSADIDALAAEIGMK